MNQEEEKSTKLKKVLEIVNKSDICSIRNIVSGVIKIINDPESNAKDLMEMIQIDPPLTAKLLKLANSAYYSPQTKINEIQQAMIWVGYDALKALALRQKICAVFDGNSTIKKYSRPFLWKHSIAVSLLGKMIYRREFREKGENIYVAGLLHDIGIIVIDQFHGDEFRLILNNTKREKKNHIKAEKKVLGFDHAEVGKAIANDWNLPQELVEIIGCHHNPDNIAQEFEKAGSTLYVADCVCQQKGFGYGDAPIQDKGLFKRCLKRLNLTSYALDLMAEDVQKELFQMEEQGLL